MDNVTNWAALYEDTVEEIVAEYADARATERQGWADRVKAAWGTPAKCEASNTIVAAQARQRAARRALLAKLGLPGYSPLTMSDALERVRAL